jgi:hypothetical protein
VMTQTPASESAALKPAAGLQGLAVVSGESQGSEWPPITSASQGLQIWPGVSQGFARVPGAFPDPQLAFTDPGLSEGRAAFEDPNMLSSRSASSGRNSRSGGNGQQSGAG